jgi:hypothetical protein
MKRVIDGKTYNTDTAAKVARYEYVDPDDYETEATVYVTAGGAFFVVHEWEVDGKPKVYFEETTRERIATLLAGSKRHVDNIEVIDEKVLEPPPEAAAETESSATVYVRVPASLKRRVDESAAEAKLSGNAYMLRCMESCLKDFSDYKSLFSIWDIASTFRAHSDGEWSREKCIEALSEIADLAEELVGELFPPEFSGQRPDQILANALVSYEIEAQDIRDRYRPYGEE